MPLPPIILHADAAVKQLKQIVALTPADTLSAQLIKQVSGGAEGSPEPQPAPPGAPPDAAPVDRGKLAGSWTASPAQDTTIALTIRDDDTFDWEVTSKGKSQDITGNWSLTNGVLTLAQSGQGGPLQLWIGGDLDAPRPQVLAQDGGDQVAYGQVPSGAKLRRVDVLEGAVPDEERRVADQMGEGLPLGVLPDERARVVRIRDGAGDHGAVDGDDEASLLSALRQGRPGIPGVITQLVRPHHLVPGDPGQEHEETGEDADRHSPDGPVHAASSWLIRSSSATSTMFPTSAEPP